MTTAEIDKTDLERLMGKLQAAHEAGRITPSAAANVRQWLAEPRYREYASLVAQHIEQDRWKELDDVFWTVIPFGTGGRRGKMYPIGCNAINERTIGESVQGLATYVRRVKQQEAAGAAASLSCAIAFDTRHRSPEFARLAAEIMVANGFKVYLLEEHRSTPELSFLVRHKGCDCGVMVTASHNPPSDNAVKVYWSNGAQILPPHDRGIIDCVMQVDAIERADFDEALKGGKIEACAASVDQAYLQVVAAQSFPGPRDIRVLYSPLHGVGSTSVVPALHAAGFQQVEVYGPHAEPSGDFPNVPDHIANPENRAVFDAPIAHARESGADLVIATDPDCDRLGCAAPLTTDLSGPWQTFTGNQIGALLADYVLEQLQQQGRLTAQHYLVKTLVTTEMVRRIGESYGVQTVGDLLVGFKWIAQVIDREGPEHFVLGVEESHGYLVGSYARDKDGAVASMLMAEVAAHVKKTGRSLHEKLDALFWQHGYHAERLLNLSMPGSQGMARMQALMQRFRSDPPQAIAGMAVQSVRDYKNLTRLSGGRSEKFQGPQADLVMIDLDQPGNYLAVRPSGTEPKVKFYMFTFVPPEQLADLDQTRRDMEARLDAFEASLRELANSVP